MVDEKTKESQVSTVDTIHYVIGTIFLIVAVVGLVYKNYHIGVIGVAFVIMNFLQITKIKKRTHPFRRPVTVILALIIIAAFVLMLAGI
jgi:succinate dehydrogenase/fumarate reductase cytochrome b subunit